MTRQGSAILVCAWLSIAAVAAAAAQFGVMRVGRGTIDGVVVDDSSEQPIPDVLVRLIGAGVEGLAASTDERGRFSFRQVPAGRFDLVPSKELYVRPRWSVGQPPRAVALEAAQQISGLRLRLSRGGALSGVIRDPSGRGLPDARVYLLRCAGGGCLPTGQQTRTDGSGAYRLHGIVGGRYAIAAESTFRGNDAGLEMTTDAEIRWARLQLTGVVSAPPPPDAASSSYLLTFYPATTRQTDAQVVVLEAGEDRGAIDVTLQIGRTGRITGVVLAPDGQPRLPQAISIFPAGQAMGIATSTMVRGDGKGGFATAALPPGTYRLVARSDQLHGESVATIDGQDLPGLTLQLRPSIALAGQVAVEGAENRAIDLSHARVEVRRADVAVTGSTFDVAVGMTSANGTFGLVGLAAGKYIVTVTPDPSRVPVWLTGVSIDGTAPIDTPIEIAESTEGPLRITVSANPAQIHGTVTYADGRPAAEYAIVAFAAESGSQSLPSRPFLTAVPALDGTFTIRGLPPGEYFVGAVGTSDPREIDREMLDEISATAQRLVIRAGQSARITLRPRDPPPAPRQAGRSRRSSSYARSSAPLAGG